MKQSEVKHILDITSEVKEKELVFTHLICRDNGIRQSCKLEPSSFANVKHLTGNLYYAYNSSYCDAGIVYVGEFK